MIGALLVLVADTDTDTDSNSAFGIPFLAYHMVPTRSSVFLCTLLQPQFSVDCLILFGAILSPVLDDFF